MLNMNFDTRVVINTASQEWQPSPIAGVFRKPLAREDAERGHATSIVRYDANTRFREHGHPSGEEIFVLEGIFSDETGNFPAGSYLRNPDGFIHSPFSKEGCLLLVKLHQFKSGDNEQIRVNTHTTPWLPGIGNLEVMPLHSYKGESTALVHWPAGEKFQHHVHAGGEEIYVLKGEFIDEHGRYGAGTWIRSPHMSHHTPYVEQDTIILVKVGHL